MAGIVRASAAARASRTMLVWICASWDARDARTKVRFGVAGSAMADESGVLGVDEGYTCPPRRTLGLFKECGVDGA